MTPHQFKTIRGKRTLSDLANLIGVHTRTIRRYEHGDTPIHKPVQILMQLIKEGRYG